MMGISKLHSVGSRSGGASGETVRTTVVRIAISFGLLFTPVSAAWSDYKIGVGDVVDIYVARVPEMQRRVSVKTDGSISFPLLGSTPVAGLTPAQMEAKIQAALAAKIFQRRTVDGRQSDVVISPDEITATVVEFRPIYVNGDVSKPGEYTYRPNMTSLQAVAMAGGYNLLRSRILDPFLDLIGLRSEAEAIRAELTREEAQLWRIHSELDELKVGHREGIGELPVDGGFGGYVRQIENERLAAVRSDQARERAFLDLSIKNNEEQVRILSEQQKEEESGLKADVDEMRKAQQLYGSGTLTNLRLTDMRRAVMLSATRKLQTTAQLLQIRKQRDELARNLEGIGEKYKLELLKDLQDATVRSAALRAKLKGASEKVQYMMARSQSGQGGGFVVDLAIVRRGTTGRERLTADETTELLPGDVVEVSMRSEGTAPPIAAAAPKSVVAEPVR